jgi:hypothetical protein
MRRTPKEPLAQRLFREMAAQLAERVGCCAIHGTPLVCCLCDVAWDGSAGEELELDGLLARSAVSHVTWPTWRCGRCGTQDAALCLDCHEPAIEHVFAGLTPEEEARCGALLRTHLRFTCRRDPDADGDPLHAGGPHAVRRS